MLFTNFNNDIRQCISTATYHGRTQNINSLNSKCIFYEELKIIMYMVCGLQIKHQTDDNNMKSEKSFDSILSQHHFVLLKCIKYKALIVIFNL